RDLHSVCGRSRRHAPRAGRWGDRLRLGPRGRGSGVSQQGQRGAAGGGDGDAGPAGGSPMIERGRRYLPPVARADCRVVVIDNYDSFTFNLVQYLLELGAVVDVYRNDAVAADEVFADAPSQVLLS